MYPALFKIQCQYVLSSKYSTLVRTDTVHVVLELQ